MSDGAVGISQADLAVLATEVWRLSVLFPDGDRRSSGAAARYSIRRLAKVLTDVGCDCLDITGRQYDVGMSVEVIDTDGQPGHETPIVKEMVSPIVMLRGEVISFGQVILESRPEPTREPEGGHPQNGHD